MIIIRILELPLLRGFTLILLSIMPKLAEKKNNSSGSNLHSSNSLLKKTCKI